MDKTENKTIHSEKFTDMSRFTRWVNQLDEKDKLLNPPKRKSKWAITIAFLFLLFGLSFIWFPAAKLDQPEITTPVEKPALQKSQSTRSAFEMPADSFEIILKQKIDEDLAKEK